MLVHRLVVRQAAVAAADDDVVAGSSLARAGTIGSSRPAIDSTFVDGASGRTMSWTYSHPHAGTVQSGSNRRIACCPAAATAECDTPAGENVPCWRNIVTTAGAGEPTRARCETRSAEAGGERPAEHAATAVPDQGDGTARRVQVALDALFDGRQQTLRAPCVDRQRRARRAVADAPQPVTERPQVQIVPEEPGHDDHQPTVAARHAAAPEDRCRRATPRARQRTGSRCGSSRLDEQPSHPYGERRRRRSLRRR